VQLRHNLAASRASSRLNPPPVPQVTHDRQSAVLRQLSDSRALAPAGALSILGQLLGHKGFAAEHRASLIHRQRTLLRLKSKAKELGYQMLPIPQSG